MKKTLKEHINKINKMISRTNHPTVERKWRRKLDVLKEDTSDKMRECQENNVGDLTPQDEKQFGILFNSVDPMGTNEDAVYSVISKDNYNYFNSTVRVKFDKRIKCIKGDEFSGIIDFIVSDFSGQERKKVRDMLLKTVRK